MVTGVVYQNISQYGTLLQSDPAGAICAPRFRFGNTVIFSLQSRLLRTAFVVKKITLKIELFNKKLQIFLRETSHTVIHTTPYVAEW